MQPISDDLKSSRCCRQVRTALTLPEKSCSNVWFIPPPVGYTLFLRNQQPESKALALVFYLTVKMCPGEQGPILKFSKQSPLSSTTFSFPEEKSRRFVAAVLDAVIRQLSGITGNADNNMKHLVGCIIRTLPWKDSSEPRQIDPDEA